MTRPEALPRLPLALTPTPEQRLSRLSEALGAEVFIKRDDLTGNELSGNKVRKLELILAKAVAEGADTVITTGGIQSNHARATAFAARKLGLEPILLLRGAPPQAPESNLLLDALAGARVVWCTADDYRHRRDEIMAEIADAERSRGRRPAIIPEGGSNGLGSLGYVLAARELTQAYDHVVVAVGSGGTVAGLAMSGLGFVHGVAVCDDRAYFSARVHAIAAEAREHADVALGVEGSDWEITEGYQGSAYSVAGPEVWDSVRWLARTEGLLVDPTYTGKAFHALRTEVAAGRWGGRVLFWHTGGTFGLFGRGAEIAG